MAGKVVSIRKSKTLTYDRRIGLFEGGHANAKTWHSTSMMWSDLVTKLETPLRTGETMQDYDCAKAEKAEFLYALLKTNGRGKARNHTL